MKTSLVVALFVLATVATAAAQVYRWTDDEGVIHLTTDASRIPAKHRARVEVLEASPREPVESPRIDFALPTSRGQAIVAEAHLNGVPLTLLVDTGASRTVITPAVLGRAGIDVSAGRPVRITGVGGAVRAVEVVVARLDVAGAQIGPLEVVAHDVPGLAADGLLGRDVLEHFTLTIDPARGRVILSR
jgi:predicted aspartyl protease